MLSGIRIEHVLGIIGAAESVGSSRCSNTYTLVLSCRNLGIANELRQSDAEPISKLTQLAAYLFPKSGNGLLKGTETALLPFTRFLIDMLEGEYHNEKIVEMNCEMFH
ncbi:MAG: hypothetical protein PVF15_00200 [Candidatus Bathyarchaeota archaeon]|jgi:hypothetical protein